MNDTLYNVDLRAKCGISIFVLLSKFNFFKLLTGVILAIH